jgi:hydrogenase nickel incorporation protein HypA/HybF
MHEFGVAASVLEAVEARAAGRPVSALRLHVGALRRLDRDVFDQAFALVGGGGVADGAYVDVVEVAVEVRCRGCEHVTVADELVTACVRCGAHDLELLHGDDLVLESITIAGRVAGGQEVR